MEAEQKAAIAKKIGTTPKVMKQFVRLYNELCRKCQQKTAAMGGNVTPEVYCEECKPKAEIVAKRVNEWLQGNG